jgi:hypothetical protein
MDLTSILLNQCSFRPGDLVIANFARDGSGNVEYIGFAKSGSLDGTASWTIFKNAYTSGNIDTWRCGGTNQIWTDRASLTYA